MAFETIVPKAAVKSGAFKIMSVARQGGAFRLVLSIPSTRYTLAFGQADRLTVKIGSGSDEGRMALIPDPQGAFKPTFLKHAVILRLPELDFTPQFKAEAADPETKKSTDGGLIVTLPEWAWKAERQKAILKAREHVERERAAERSR